MVKRLLLILVGTALVITGVWTIVPPPEAAARSCADVEVVFARGTAETAPPVGLTGLSFVEALKSRLPGKSVVVSAVRYPASSNFDNRRVFVQNVVAGIENAQAQIKRIAARCPDTDIVLGGYSQGAVVAGYAVSPSIDLPARYAAYEDQVPRPLPPGVADQVAAVVLFAPASDRWLRDLGAPPIVVSPTFRAKTVRYCIAGDNVCDGSPVGGPNGLHVLYAANGMTVAAADFTAVRI